MAKYKYQITDKFGKEKKGVLDAVNIDAATAKLKGDGSIVLSIKESTSISDSKFNVTIGNPVKKKDITVFCRQFHSILVAGVTVIDGLQMVQEQTQNKYLRTALFNVMVAVQKGDTLADAMAAEGKVFPELLIHMVKAGEATGNLEVAFERVCKQFDKDLKLTSMVRSAMIYPIVVLVVAIAVIIILMTTVIPNFAGSFKEMNMELPWLTKAVMAMSDFITENIVFVLGGLILIVVLILWFKKTETGKKINSKMILKLPLVKDFSIKSNSSKFAMTMATLITSGVPIVEALDIVADVIPNRVIRQSVYDAKDEVMQGVPLSEPLEMGGIFPPMVYHMTKIGEETGTTEQMLDKVAQYYEDETEEVTKNLTTAMEPMIIIVLAVLVGGIIGAVMMPMLDIYQNAGNA